MHQWERNLCPTCTLIWERNLDGAWRYISLIAVPLPTERACPICTNNFQMTWVTQLPTLPDDPTAEGK
ncbi:MAG TPA: hypothetical protein VFU49_05540 [Ktedonobacteraceae bacterium]|nr:hypothetical protein [Ktedonobacteraceae bacterium]